MSIVDEAAERLKAAVCGLRHQSAILDYIIGYSLVIYDVIKSILQGSAVEQYRDRNGPYGTTSIGEYEVTYCSTKTEGRGSKNA